MACILVKLYWPVRKKSWRAWLLLGLLFGMHLAAYILLLHHLQDVPILSYVLTIATEVIVFQAIIYKLVGVLPPKLKL